MKPNKVERERERISLFLFISFFLFFQIQISNSQILRVCGYDLMLIKMNEYEFMGGKNGGDEDWVTKWEVRLPSVDDLTPLSQLLISLDLASMFSILPEPYRTAMEVNRTSQTMFSTLRGVNHSMAKGSLFETTDPNQDSMVVEADENEITDRDESGSDPKKSRLTIKRASFLYIFLCYVFYFIFLRGLCREE